MSLMSFTEIGSTPANGSSNSMNLGSAAKARAISARRRSPPETLMPKESLMWVILKSANNSVKRCCRCCLFRSLRVSKIAIIFSEIVNFLKIEASCGK